MRYCHKYAVPGATRSRRRRRMTPPCRPITGFGLVREVRLTHGRAAAAAYLVKTATLPQVPAIESTLSDVDQLLARLPRKSLQNNPETS